MNQITQSNLQAVCDRINRMTNSPLAPYCDDKSNVGNYHIDHAYSGVALHRMDNESGGVQDVLQCGHTTKRDLYDRMHAFIRGWEACNRVHELCQS